jgi:hypothetical protein
MAELLLELACSSHRTIGPALSTEEASPGLTFDNWALEYFAAAPPQRTKRVQFA